MWHWVVFTALILLVPSYFGLLHARELLRAFRAGELRLLMVAVMLVVSTLVNVVVKVVVD